MTSSLHYWSSSLLQNTQRRAVFACFLLVNCKWSITDLLDSNCATNHFLAQCNGVIVDLKEEEVVYFPLCHQEQIEKLATPDWPIDRKIPHYSVTYGSFIYSPLITLQEYFFTTTKKKHSFVQIVPYHPHILRKFQKKFEKRTKFPLVPLIRGSSLGRTRGTLLL